MPHLSSRSQELFKFLQIEYIDNGYMYSGSWPYMSLLERGYSKGDIDALLTAGVIQKRNCDDLAYELTAPERDKLLQEYDLPTRWKEQAGKGLFTSIQNEIQHVKAELNPKKPALSQIIHSAEQRIAGVANNFLFLTPDPVGTWSASVSPEAKAPNSVMLAQEREYPVELIYRRTDINGSGVVEGFTCKTQEDLLDSLNWLGKCGLVPLQLWDFDIDKSDNQQLFNTLNAGVKYRYEQIRRDLDEMYACFDDDDEPIMAPDHHKEPEPER